MADLEKIFLKIKQSDMAGAAFTAAPAMLAVTLIYLIAVLSIPVQAPQRLIWLLAYPIIASEMTGIGFGRVFVRSLWIIPVAGLIGMFNPILDKETAFMVYGVPVSRGWVSFVSILLRGLLSIQAVILLVMNTGFIDLFNSLRRMKFPSVLTTQMLLTYRYITVVMEEAVVMQRARKARGYGRTKYPISEWGRFVGSLLLRSAHRASRIHQAMKARGFNGTLPMGTPLGWNVRAWIWLIAWTVVIILLRVIDFSSLLPKF